MDQHTKKDAENKDFVAYAMIPVWLIRAGKDVSPGAVRMYAVIKSYTKNGENTAYPSQKLIAKDLGVSERQVHTLMHQLYDCGALDYELRKNEDGTRGRNYVYTLAWEKPFKRQEMKHRKKTSTVSPEENFDNSKATPEENFQSTVEENFRSIPEENFDLTTPNEHTPNRTKNSSLEEVPLSGAENALSDEGDNADDLEIKRIKEQIFESLGMTRHKAS